VKKLNQEKGTKMINRRDFLYGSTVLVGTILMGCSSSSDTATSSTWHMPEEGEAHAQTWMAFIANDEIWESKQIPEVQENLALIARTIAKYEPLSILVREEDYETALALIGTGHAYPVRLIISNLNDFWLRDTGPTFVLNEKGEKAGIDFNFNGWGEDQIHHHDAKVAGFINTQLNVPTLNTDLILEGGCFEVDGEGMAILTESCVLNDNRNPNKTKAEVESELKRLLGLKKIIWLEGIKGKDITDGHTDFYARFAKPGVIVASYDSDTTSYDHAVTTKNIETLKAATDANGNAFEVVVLETPMQINETFGVKDFAAGYIGYYVCNNAIIMQGFGDEQADSNAKKALEKLFPQRTVEQIRIDGIASGGGSIHCATQQ